MKLVHLHVCGALLLACVCSLGRAEDWPQFRGPDGQGHSATTGLPTKWSETENVAWKTRLPGHGHSSPVILGDEIWMTTATARPVSKEEKEKRLVANTGSQPLTVVSDLSMRAICVHRASGKLLHDIDLMKEESPEPVHTLNNFAAPTPILEGGRLYCYFGTNGWACLDTRSGKVLWTNRELRLKHENGAGSSPVSYHDLLIAHCDGSDVQYIVALRKKNGEVAWKTERSGRMNSNPQLKKAYGTPLIVKDPKSGRDLLMSPAANWLYCYDPASGRELWKLPYDVLGFSIVPRPVAQDGVLYMCTSFMRSELLAVRYDGRRPSESPRVLWRFKKQVPQKPSPLLVGNELYMVGDRGVATCLDAKTGQVHWTSRLGGNFSASPLYADGKIFFSSHEGITTVVEPGLTFKKLATNQLRGGHMASAAAVDGALYFRTDQALYRIQE